jgi:hypothetical protein
MKAIVKKITGILAVLLLISMFGFADEDVKVGNGAQSNSDPIILMGHDAVHVQYLYLASEIDVAEGGTISSIMVNVAYMGGAQTFSNFTIKLGSTTDTELTTSEWLTTSTTCIEDSTIVYTMVMADQTFTFENDFIYDGTSNIIVDIEYNNLGNGVYNYVHTTGADLCHYYYSDAKVSGEFASTTRNDMTFHFSSIGGQAPAPVDLVYFNGKRDDGFTLLRWETLSEKNNDYFQIERGVTPNSFMPIGYRDGSGNTSVTQFYEYVDNEAFMQTMYYRLKQVDFDGSYEYSDVIAINPDMVMFNVNTYPNPFISDITVDIPTNSTTQMQLQLIDQNGRVLQEKDVICNSIRFTGLTDLSSGNYYIRLVSGDLTETKQIIKL